MCVGISLLPGATLTRDELDNMRRTNADGTGLAWVRNDGLVGWCKALNPDLDSLKELIDNFVDRPRLLHFRLATIGEVTVELCHPFEIGVGAACGQRGKARRVMIHNGHFNRFHEVFDLMKKQGILPDDGPWSDTRLIAFATAFDPGWLTALGGKVAILNGEGQLHHLGDWLPGPREGIQVSNNHWQTRTYTAGGYAGYRDWKGWKGWTEEEWESYEKECEDARAARDEKQGKQGKLVEVTTTKDNRSWKQRKEETRAAALARRETRKLLAADGAEKVSDRRSDIPELWVNPYTGVTFEVRPDGTLVQTSTTDSGN